MFTATKRATLMNGLVALWHANRSNVVKPAHVAPTSGMRYSRTMGKRGLKVIRAGRDLTKADFARWENVNPLKGGDSNVQFGLLGSFGGIRILGESPG